MQKKQNFKLQLSNTLNRSMVITAYPNDEPLYFAILSNKKSSGLETQYDTKNSLIENQVVRVRMHRNLNNCMFSTTFFLLESLEDAHRDFRTRFFGLNESYKDAIFQFFSEKLDLRAPTEYKEKDNSNYLMITGWQFYDFKKDLQFYFVQRKIYNTVTRTSVIRTMALQLTTDKGYEILEKYHNDFLNNHKNEDKKVALPDYLKINEEEKLERDIFVGSN